MPVYKGQFVIALGPTGWTETIYFNATSVNDALNIMDSMAGHRANGFGVTGTPRPIINYLRVAQVLPKGPAEVRPATKIYGPSDNLGAPDMPWTGVLVSLFTSTGRKRSYNLRGVPDIGTEQPWYTIVPGPLRIALTDYLDELKSGNFLMRVQKDNPLINITSIIANTDGSIAVTVSGGHGLGTNNRVAWYRVDAPGLCLRGVSKVVTTGLTTFVVPKVNVGRFNFVMGQYRVLEYEYEAISNYTFERKGSHKTGRPFSPLAGRRSTCRH